MTPLAKAKAAQAMELDNWGQTLIVESNLISWL